MMLMWVGSHLDVVQSRKSKASRMSTTPEGAGRKTPMVTMVPRVSMTPMVPWISVMSKGMPDGVVGRNQHEKSK